MPELHISFLVEERRQLQGRRQQLPTEGHQGNLLGRWKQGASVHHPAEAQDKGDDKQRVGNLATLGLVVYIGTKSFVTDQIARVDVTTA